MGTNYYLKLPGKEPCEHCGRGDVAEELHIGKSSAGWCFALHVIPERSINDLEDWLPLFERGAIRDEYDAPRTAQEMIAIITGRGWRGRPSRDTRWCASNQAEPGPNGLARHQVGMHCVKHGEGTWDCIEGEFS